SLLESELFGYEEGGFTGAVKGGKKGYFEEADGGTIFLDEIGDMDLALQAKLLRVLQEKEIVRVGGTNPISINVRVIAATNANLEQRIKEGTFREDLYYRLNVVPIFIPPLRGRKKDIPLLAAHLCEKIGQEYYKRKAPELSPAVIDLFMTYDWPGNIRELENIVGRSIINMNSSETIMLPKHIPFLNSNTKPQWLAAGNILREPEAEATANQKLSKLMDSTEKDILQKTLQSTKGNKTKAAKQLGIAVRSLYYKLEKYGML
ncbi:MAG: sigma 54-interacting transcriptional regulator, partial [Eubacteriales bacterium]|nr:sigma 54-interacting transcriptional regulator [Eubacteriales bacterium]